MALALAHGYLAGLSRSAFRLGADWFHYRHSFGWYGWAGQWIDMERMEVPRNSGMAAHAFGGA